MINNTTQMEFDFDLGDDSDTARQTAVGLLTSLARGIEHGELNIIKASMSGDVQVTSVEEKDNGDSLSCSVSMQSDGGLDFTFKVVRMNNG